MKQTLTILDENNNEIQITVIEKYNLPKDFGVYNTKTGIVTLGVDRLIEFNDLEGNQQKIQTFINGLQKVGK